MQYRVYDQQTLEYIDGGYVQSWNIDDDYIVNNNSTISVVKKVDDTLSNVVVGNIIVLIQDNGAFHKGVITAVDDTALSISYKSDKELFNDNITNPHATDFAADKDLKIVGKFGIEYLARILEHYFSDTDDELKKLPLIFITDGDVLDEEGNPKMLWTWSNDSINIADWLTELFEKYNLSLSWDIDFDISNDDLKSRKPRYIVTLSAITKSGGIVKDNVAMQTITYTVKEIPDATVCYVIDSSTKELIYMSSGMNLLNPATVKASSNSSDTNISSYITVKLKDKYTLSLNSADNNERQIFIYNKKKERLGYYKYSGTQYTFGGNGEDDIKPTPTAQVEENGTKRTITVAELIANAKYIQANYYNGATEVQLEKGDTKTDYDAFTHPAIFYLYEKGGEYSISTDKNKQLSDGRKRVLPVKTVIATYSESSSSSTDETKPEDVAKDKLIPSQFNQAIEIRINSDSKMFDFVNAKFGDQYQIINEQGNVNSVFTGKKITNKEKYTTLYFGLGRQNYTDKQQIKFRKRKYTEVYNQGRA